MQKIILQILILCVVFGIYNKFVIYLANKSAYNKDFHFVGVLSGGNLDFSEDVLQESLYQLSWDIKIGKLNEALYEYDI